MKKVFLIILLSFVFIGFTYADPAVRNQFNGTWSGNFIGRGSGGGDQVFLKIEITNSRVISYNKTWDDNGKELWIPSETDEDYYLYAGNNLIYSFVSKSWNYSRAVVISLSYINPRTLHVFYMTHDNEYQTGQSNEVYFFSGEGQLRKDY
ncbi:hypothetical protein R84B8_02367 [Treponema sp. R8-4-B8]